MSKKVSLSNRNQVVLLTMIYMEIQRSEEAKKVGIKPVNTPEELKALYKKIAGYEYEWEDLG